MGEFIAPACFSDDISLSEFGSPKSYDSGCLDIFPADDGLPFADLDFDMGLLDDLCNEEINSDAMYAENPLLCENSDFDATKSAVCPALNDHDYTPVCQNAEEPKAFPDSSEEEGNEMNYSNAKSAEWYRENSRQRQQFTRRELSELPKNRKNAELARLNRLRKKRYVAGLENELKTCKQNNVKLALQNKKLTKLTGQLEDRVAYLTRVLENESTLSAVLSAVSSVPGLDVHLPGQKNRGKSTETKNSQSTGRSGLRSSAGRLGNQAETQRVSDSRSKRKLSQSSGGICLHIANNNVCIEFCEKCAENAAK